MGNKNSTQLPTGPRPLLKITPKVLLMKLKSAKNIRNMLVKSESNSFSKPLINPESIRVIRNSRMSVSDEKSSLKWPKAVFKMIETAHTDVPCDMEEESESPKLSPVKEKINFWRGRRTYANKTPTNGSKRDFNFKRRNALRTQHKLMQALFDTEICSSCLRPLIDKGAWLRNACGHVFHSNCATCLDSCPECHKSMNTIEIM